MRAREIRSRLITGTSLVKLIRENPDLKRDTVLKATRPLGYTRQGVDYAYRANGIRHRPTIRSDRGQSRNRSAARRSIGGPDGAAAGVDAGT